MKSCKEIIGENSNSSFSKFIELLNERLKFQDPAEHEKITEKFLDDYPEFLKQVKGFARVLLTN